MNHSKKSGRLYSFLAVAVFASTAIATHRYGRPWIEYHQQNLVVYDCRLQSEAIPLGAKYPGRIAELFVQTGQKVAPGDIVARMDTSELTVEAQRAKAAIELAEANLNAEQLAIDKALETMIAQQKCLDVKTQVAASRWEAIKQEAKWIEKELVRAKQLSKRGSVSKSNLEKLLRERGNFESKAQIAGEEDLVARLDLAALKSKVEEIKSRTALLAALEKEVEIARAELNAIRERQASAMIRASSAGIVTNIFRGAGSSVKLGDPIIQLRTDEVWSEVWIDETKLPEVQLGSTAVIKLTAFGDEEFDGLIVGFLPIEGSQESGPQLTENPILRLNSKVCLKVNLRKSGKSRLIPGLTGTAIIPKSSLAPNRISPSPVVSIHQSGYGSWKPSHLQ